MIDNIFTGSSLLTSYLKYFISTLNGNSILVYNNKENIIYNKLKELEPDIYLINNKKNVYNGIVINNIDTKLDNNLFDNIYNILDEDGKILLIIHTHEKIKCYDDEEISILNEYVLNLFNISEELISDASWKFLIITKNTIK
jgi:hypothetical protein